MDEALIIVLSFFLLVVPILIAQTLVLYDGTFQNNSSLLNRMLFALSEEDRQPGKDIRNQHRCVFLIYWIGLILSILVLFLHFFINLYLSGIENFGEFEYQLIISFVFLSLAGFVYYAYRVYPSTEINQWKAILASQGIFLEDYTFDLPYLQGSKFNKYYTLIRSYFKSKHPEKSPFSLPLSRYHIFPFSNPRIESEDGDFKLQAPRDLKIADLWWRPYNPLVLIFLMVIGFVTLFLAVRIAPIELAFSLSPSNSVFEFSLLFGISMITLSIFLLLYQRYELFNDKVAKRILEIQDVSYSEDTYLQDIEKLIESRFPFIHLNIVD